MTHNPSTHRNRRLSVLALCILLAVLLGAAVSSVQAQGITDEDVRNLGRGGNATTRNTNASGDVSPWGTLGKMMGALALVLGLIAGAAWVARRYLPGAGAGQGTGRGDAIRVLSTRMLGHRRSLMLVRVRGQTLLLGMTPQSITTLTEIDEVEGEWAQPAAAEGGGSSSTFDRRLGRLIQHEVGEESDAADSPGAYS